MLDEAKLIDFIVEFTKQIESKLQYFVEFQASTILMESFCDFIVFFNDMDNLNEAQILIKRDTAKHDYIPITSIKEQQKLIQKCITKYDEITLLS